MLGYLDALIAALSVRDHAETVRLLAHPLARLLPEAVVAEAATFATADGDPLATPLRTIQLRYQTAELLRDAPLAADQPEPPAAMPVGMPSGAHGRRNIRQQQQIELPLSA